MKWPPFQIVGKSGGNLKKFKYLTHVGVPEHEEAGDETAHDLDQHHDQPGSEAPLSKDHLW